jgi:SAM-dependent methyltransferase
MFVQISKVPVLCNALWPSKQNAINAPQGDIRLGVCRDCHHIYNYAFNLGLMDYSQGYENALHFSHRFQDYARSLAERLVKRFSLRHKALVEIGCGDGAFLNLLCELGDNCGVGFEPGTDPHSFRAESASQRTLLINDAYSSQYADVPVDFICCRHVLEHIPSPRDFMQHLSEMLGSKGPVKLYFEVPNVRFILSEQSFWDFIYEHCSYFGANSLEALFRYSGFEILSVTEQYENQFLTIDASHDAKSRAILDTSPGVTAPLIGVEDFQTRYESVVVSWKHRLAQMRGDGLKIVVWGMGSKGVSFLNILAAQDQIEYVIDINPRKHGRYVAGTGQEIKPPEFLKTYQPDVIIIMNRVYQQEIHRSVQELGLHTELLSV